MSKVKKAVKVMLKAVAHPRHAKKTIMRAAERRTINNRRRADYIAWFEKQKLTKEQLDEQREAAKKLKKQPLISVLIPTYNTHPTHLRECLDSVVGQTYENWEICISDDASPDQATRDVIREYADKYKNVQAVYNKTNGHIAVSSNIALKMAKGEYVSLLDHDDLLLPNALYETVVKLNEHPNADLIYSDEDKLEDGEHVEPFFKPSWSPDFLNSCNYITHFATLSKKILIEVNGFTPGTQGAQDWDLFLRVTAKTNKIYHIPKIIYTWRKSATSTAQSANSKPYAYINQKKVLRQSLRARGVNAWVEPHPALGFWRVRYGIVGTPLVSIVIPSKDNYECISRCVDSIFEGTTYPYFEVIIVDTGTTDKKVLDYYDKITQTESQVRIVNLHKKQFNFSDACNTGAKDAKGEYLLFLNNDTSVFGPDWIQGLLEHAQRPNVGMVGAKLLFPNDTLQHAGVVLSERDVAFHAFYGQDQTQDIFTYIYSSNVRNTAAVTAACCMVDKKKFEKVGGFDPTLRVTYNDVDLCLRLLDAGYFNVYNPFVELYHYESVSVGRINTSDRDRVEFNEAKALMQKRWKKYLVSDPFYNANFEQHGPGYRLPR